MHTSYTEAWPVMADAGRRVLAQSLNGEMLKGRIEHAGYMPGEDEQIPMFSLTMDDDEMVDWAELGGWKFI